MGVISCTFTVAVSDLTICLFLVWKNSKKENWKKLNYAAKKWQLALTSASPAGTCNVSLHPLGWIWPANWTSLFLRWNVANGFEHEASKKLNKEKKTATATKTKSIVFIKRATTFLRNEGTQRTSKRAEKTHENKLEAWSSQKAPKKKQPHLSKVWDISQHDASCSLNKQNSKLNPITRHKTLNRL